MIKLCKSTFKDEEIKHSKSLLFDSISSKQRKIQRKNKGKEERDLEDIINVFKSVEPDEIPIFVARNLDKLPPITFDHLDCTKLLKDIEKVRMEIDTIKATYATLDHLHELRLECLQSKSSPLPPESICKVNMKRGAWGLDSGPMGISHQMNSTLHDDSSKSLQQSNYLECKQDTLIYRDIERVNARTQSAAHDSLIQRAPSVHINNTPTVVSSSKTGYIEATSAANRSCTPHVQKPISNNESADERTLPAVNEKDVDGWITYESRKKRYKASKYRFMGKKGIASDLECNFKAAEAKIPIFISNIHKDTQEKDIVEYIRMKTQESVTLGKINTKRQTDYIAYKFFVSEHKLPSFLDEKLWPKGVIFRKFVHYRNRGTSEHGPFVNKDG
uniref:Mutant cadherin n=1 Tax=Heliothis virescens TaxID=7102 RepID=A0A2A4JVX2_HELVI